MKHQDLTSKMTLEEKAAILSGKTVWQTMEIPRLQIPAIFCSDGPHGLRRQAGEGDHLGLNASLPATCFPTAATIANSWNTELGEKLGSALGEEAAAQKVDVLLGPGLNIKRSPLCGRNFEYFSEDPYLAGKMAASYVRGIQSKGVYACPKHFAVNSQELRRMAMDSVLDERTLREIYLTGFEIAIKEGKAKAIMSSYNEVNGTYANENPHLLLDILRKEWEFEGIVVTDWGASNDHAKGVACRSNLEMPAPGLDSARELLEAVEAKKLSMDELDQCVDDLLEAILELSAQKRGEEFDQEKHHEIAREAAEESIVLLKNEKQVLPLKAGTKVALIGDFAFEPRYQGAGSSMVNPTRLETMENEIMHYDLQLTGKCRGYRRTGENDTALEQEALHVASQSDVILYCFGLDELSESEGLDRAHMKIPQNQIDLLEKLFQCGKPVIGILSAGSATEMTWEKNLTAIVHGYLGGQASASAMLNVLTGRVNPSGHLNETYPLAYEDTPAYHYFPSEERTAQYREGIYVGYRYYDTAKKPVRYPFGYGLSYTTFTFSDLKEEENGISVKVANTGDADGAAVVQMYVSLPKARVFRPEKELKGFTKVFLKAGESRTVSIAFDDKTFRYWNDKTGGWEIEEGEYLVAVGENCEAIHETITVHRAGSTVEIPDVYQKEMLPSYYNADIQNVTDSEFAKLLGHEIPSGKWSGSLNKNDAICQLYYAKSPIARLIYRILTSMKNKSEAKGKPDLNILFIYNMPFRGIAKMTAGAVSRDMVDGMVTAVNGHFFRGLGQIIKGYFVNAKANKAYEKKLEQTGAEK